MKELYSRLQSITEACMCRAEAGCTQMKDTFLLLTQGYVPRCYRLTKLNYITLHLEHGQTIYACKGQ